MSSIPEPTRRNDIFVGVWVSNSAGRFPSVTPQVVHYHRLGFCFLLHKTPLHCPSRRNWSQVFPLFITGSPSPRHDKTNSHRSGYKKTTSNDRANDSSQRL